VCLTGNVHVSVGGSVCGCAGVSVCVRIVCLNV